MAKTTKATKRNNTKKATTTAKAARERNMTKAMLPQCFLNDGEDFVWMAKGGIPVEQRLPYVASKYENALKEAEIPYRYAYIPNKYKEGEMYAVCEYWNPECPMQEKTLPVYIKSECIDGEYLFTGDYVTRQVVSGKVVHLAKKLDDKIKYACAKIDLGGKIATVVRRSPKMPREVNFEGADGTIKLLQAYSAEGKPTGIFGMFDMNMVGAKSYIELRVPKEMAGTVIGKNGQNKGYWDTQLGGKNVVVVPE